jgi:hypothetical protein
MFTRGSKKRITTLGAEKVLFVICPQSERGIVKADKPLFDNGSFTVVTPWCKVLCQREKESEYVHTNAGERNEPRDNPNDNTVSLHAPVTYRTQSIGNTPGANATDNPPNDGPAGLWSSLNHTSASGAVS